MAEPTPGPWQAQEDVYGHWYIWHETPYSGVSIASVIGFPLISRRPRCAITLIL